ncbi:MAG: hypothetical protein ACI3V2_03380 [Faecousia sp.]
MIPTDRFLPLAMQRRKEFQPECPVYVHCSRRSIERGNGAVLLQVRLFNCGEREIRTVFLNAEGLDVFGRTCYRVCELPMTNCAAKPRSVFGEEHMFVLPRAEVEYLRVTVERVIFADGTRWRRLPTHRLCTPQEAGSVECACGFPNPPLRERCMACGNVLPSGSRVPLEDVRYTAAEKPAPILRSFTPQLSPWAEEEGQAAAEMPIWERVLLCIFGGAALFAVIAFVFFCLTRYGGARF